MPREIDLERLLKQANGEGPVPIPRTPTPVTLADAALIETPDGQKQQVPILMLFVGKLAEIHQGILDTNQILTAMTNMYVRMHPDLEAEVIAHGGQEDVGAYPPDDGP